MLSLTNKNIEFLSDEELINILRSILDEIDVVASSGAHRSTTYLAVSAIEGLLCELLILLGIKPNDVGRSWPKYKKDHPKQGQYKVVSDFKLWELVTVIKKYKGLPTDFTTLYQPALEYRNYIHPSRELDRREQLKPIKQSIGQLSLACLNALIEHYETWRFIAGKRWELVYGIARVPGDNVIRMPQKPGEAESLLVTQLPAQDIREITFDIVIPQNAIFNFVYNYQSQDDFRAARIEGRANSIGKGFDNGRLLCTKWEAWSISDPYTSESEPAPTIDRHSMKVVLDSSEAFDVTVDDIKLELKGNVPWGFDPQGQIGFMTEHGAISILDISIQG